MPDVGETVDVLLLQEHLSVLLLELLHSQGDVTRLGLVDRAEPSNNIKGDS